MVDYLNIIAALLFVILLIWLTSVIVRRIGLESRLLGHTKNNRLSVSSSLMLDPRRRLVIIKQDGAEHTLLLGPNNDIVIATDIKSVSVDSVETSTTT